MQRLRRRGESPKVDIKSKASVVARWTLMSPRCAVENKVWLKGLLIGFEGEEFEGAALAVLKGRREPAMDEELIGEGAEGAEG